MPTIRGIDCSNNNGAIDWAAVAAAGIQFAMIKFSEGTFFTDAFAPDNWAGARANGIIRIAYHFARPDLSSAEDELTHFQQCVAAAGGIQPDDGAMLDMEMSPAGLRPGILSPTAKIHPVSVQAIVRHLGRQHGAEQLFGPQAAGTNLQPWTLSFLQDGAAAFTFKPMLYSGLWFMEPHGLTGDAALAEYGLALAAYQATLPPTPPAWPFIAIWQDSDIGTIPGVNGPCDTDVFNGTTEQLRAYGLQAPIKPPMPAMSNDDVVETLRRLLGAGALNPAAAIAYLQQFV